VRRRIVITGASSGIGRALAERLAGPSVELIITGRRRDRLAEVATTLREKGADVQTHCFELSSDAEVNEFVCAIGGQSAGIDVLINNAAVIKLGAVATAEIEDLDWHYRVNLRAPVLLIRHLFKAVYSVQGQFVLINSTAGLSAYPNIGFYAATKHGLKAVADSLREEVSTAGMTVLSVFPGRTNTPMLKRVVEIEGGTAGQSAFVEPEIAAASIVRAMERCSKGEINNVAIRPGETPEFW
jgi:short-subunit dehydrogenase